MAAQSTAEPGAGTRGRGPWPGLARALHGAAPLLIAVPAAVALVTMLGRALSVTHPDLGFAATVNGDAEALYLGHTLYQDPAHGFTGQLYTPLFPFLVSLLHHIHLWGGWPLLVNYAGTLVLVGLVASVAFAWPLAGRERVLALAGAAGMGLFAWWVVSVLPVNLLYEGRSDHTAWALALVGLVLLIRRPEGSTARLALCVALLSAAFWAKQTTVVASLAVAIWMIAAAGLGAVSVRRALVTCGALLATNLVVLGLLNLATGGWEFYFDFELAQKHPRFATFGPSLREFAHYAAPALAFPLLLAAGLALLAWRRGARPSSLRVALRDSADARLAAALSIFLVIGIPAAVYFRLKVGSEANQYVGVLWGVGLLSALAWRRAGLHPATALLAAAALVGLFALAQRPGETVHGYWVAPLHRTQEYAEVSPALVDYARTHLVWEQVQSDLNVKPQRSIYPNFYNLVDLLAAGKQPLYLIRAFLDRRFDAVSPIRFPPGAASQFWNLYANGAFEEEDNYIWKMDQVIRAGYGPAAGVPAGFLARSSGPSRAPWMRTCFGPFSEAGIDFGIRRGGGFWCREGGGVLALRRTPAPISEIHGLDRVDAVGGRLLVTSSRAVTVALAGGDRRWSLTLRPAGRRTSVELTVGGRSAGPALLLRRRPGAAPVPVDFSPAGGDRGIVRAAGGGVQALLPRVPGGDLSISAERGGAARVGLAGLQLDH